VTGEIEVGDSMTRGAGLMRGSGYAVLSPCLDLTEVGSGGGSIAWIDRGGALRVGPASSGSEPGPACYGLGGTEATVADAHVVLGYLNPIAIARGTRRIHRDLAAAAIGRLADRLRVSSLDAAYGVFSIANAQMRRAIRTVSVERGRDPRSFTLIAFGGAGGIHAAALAQELEMPEVIIPIAPGLFSGLGLLLSDIAASRIISWRARVTAETLPEIATRVEELTAEARSGLDLRDRGSAEATIEATIGVRYVGQSSALQMSFDPAVTADAEVRLADDFHAEHRRVFGQAAPSEPIETVSLRVRVSLPAQRLKFADIHAASDSYDGQRTGESRDVYFGPGEGLRRTPVIDRSQLRVGGVVAGPVVIEEGDGTVLVPPAFWVALHDSGSVILTAGQ
jgi:N-methylhydantoinase A